jgi:hypothetical protein
MTKSTTVTARTERIVARAAAKLAKRSVVSLRSIGAKGSFGHLLGALYCETCAKDTAHKGNQCIICGHVEAPIIARKPRGMFKGMKRSRMAWLYDGMRHDKRMALKAQAAASRAKFEGTETT